MRVLKIFGIKENQINFSSITNNEFLKSDLKIEKLDILFKKINNND